MYEILPFWLLLFNLFFSYLMLKAEQVLSLERKQIIAVDSYAGITNRTILSGENSSIVGRLDRKQLLDASGWCANAAAMAESAPPSRSLQTRDIGKAEVRPQRSSAQVQVGAGHQPSPAIDRRRKGAALSVSCGTSGRIIKQEMEAQAQHDPG
jgi:hypothetical protein